MRATTSATDTTDAGDAGVDLVDLGMNDRHGAERLPTLPPDGPFLLAYHPGRYAVVDGRVLPLLARVNLTHGVNGCLHEASGIDWRDTTTRWAERGYTVIPHAAGPRGRSYLQRVRVRGGFAHLTVWETAHAGDGYIGRDAAGYAEWVLGLVAAGLVPEAAPYALESALHRAVAALESTSRAAARASAASLPELSARLEAQRAAVVELRRRIASRATSDPVEGDELTLTSAGESPTAPPTKKGR